MKRSWWTHSQLPKCNQWSPFDYLIFIYWIMLKLLHGRNGILISIFISFQSPIKFRNQACCWETFFFPCKKQTLSLLVNLELMKWNSLRTSNALKTKTVFWQRSSMLSSGLAWQLNYPRLLFTRDNFALRPFKAIRIYSLYKNVVLVFLSYLTLAVCNPLPFTGDVRDFFLSCSHL